MQIFRLLKAADNAGPPLVAPVATEHHWLTVDNFQIPNAIHPITVDRMAHRSQLTSTVPVAQGRIKVEWGGEVKLLPRSEFGTLHLERGATYVGEGAYIGAGTAIGNSAMAAGAVRNPQPTSPLQLQAIVDLTAAITLLTQSMAGAKSDAQPELKKLIEETEAVLPQLRSNASDKATLKDRLDEADKALGLLSKTATIGSAAMP